MLTPHYKLYDLYKAAQRVKYRDTNYDLAKQTITALKPWYNGLETELMASKRLDKLGLVKYDYKYDDINLDLQSV